MGLVILIASDARFPVRVSLLPSGLAGRLSTILLGGDEEEKKHSA